MTSLASCSAFRKAVTGTDSFVSLSIITGAVKVLDCAQLDVKEVSDLAMFICRIADTVKLQIRVAQPRFRRLFAEFRALGELDSVGRGLHTVVPNLTRISNRVEEKRR